MNTGGSRHGSSSKGAIRRLPGVKYAGVIRPSQWYAGELDKELQ